MSKIASTTILGRLASRVCFRTYARMDFPPSFTVSAFAATNYSGTVLMYTDPVAYPKNKPKRTGEHHVRYRVRVTPKKGVKL